MFRAELLSNYVRYTLSSASFCLLMSLQLHHLSLAHTVAGFPEKSSRPRRKKKKLHQPLLSYPSDIGIEPSYQSEVLCTGA